MSKTPRILKTQTLARTRLFEIEQVDLEFANGTSVQFERLRGSQYGAVLVVPMLDDDTVLLIREYAAGMDRYEMALPKGRIENAEEILVAANREIQEEVGYAARSLVHLSSVTLAPGYSNQQTHIVLARDLYPARARGDEPEPIEVIPATMDNLPALIQKYSISEARTIAALFLVQHYLRENP